jgi:hypothetical protein
MLFIEKTTSIIGACKIDTVSIIEAALVAGAAASAKDTTSQAVKDAYTGLKTLLIRLFAENPHAQVILDEHKTDPETYEKLLKKLLIEAHADQDADLLAAAEHVMTLVQPQQVGMGKYTIQNTATVQAQNIGDHQQVIQHFYGTAVVPTTDRKRTILFSAYQVMCRLVGAYEALYSAIEVNLSEDIIQIAQSSLIHALKEAEEAQSAYMFVGKEEEIHTALQALYTAFSGWASLRKDFYSLKDANSIVASLPTMSYETVQKAREQFEARRNELLTLAKSWEKELP